MYNRWASTSSPSIRATEIRGCARNSAWEETRLLVFAGRGSREKNLPVLLDAIQRLGDGYHLLLVGSNMPTRVPRNTSVVDHFCDSREVARLLASSDAAARRRPGDLRPGRTRSDGQRHSGGGGARRALAEIVPERCGALRAEQRATPWPARCANCSATTSSCAASARRHVERQHAWDAVVAGLLLHYHAVLGDSEARFPRYG